MAAKARKPASDDCKDPPAHAVHSDPATPATAEQKPMPQEMSRKPYSDKSAAEWAYQRLILYIQNFEEQLDDTQEIAVGFAGEGSSVLRIEGIGYFDPDIVTFYGTDAEGVKTQLIQHVSQLSVSLRALPKEGEEEQQPRRIGFQLAADLAAE